MMEEIYVVIADDCSAGNDVIPPYEILLVTTDRDVAISKYRDCMKYIVYGQQYLTHLEIQEWKNQPDAPCNICVEDVFIVAYSEDQRRYIDVTEGVVAESEG